MIFRQLTFRRKSWHKDCPEAIESQFREIVERYKTTALELGWLGSQDDELLRRTQAAVDAARADLTLLEAHAHGEIRVTSAARRVQLQELLGLRAEAETAGATPSRDDSESACHFNVRRTARIALLAIVFCLSLVVSRPQAGWAMYALIACLAAVWLLEPWPVSRCVDRAAKFTEQAVARTERALHVARLDVAINQTERMIIKSSLREARADLWVEKHLALVQSTMDVQRARAESAARLVAQQMHLSESEEVYRAL